MDANVKLEREVAALGDLSRDEPADRWPASYCCPATQCDEAQADRASIRLAASGQDAPPPESQSKRRHYQPNRPSRLTRDIEREIATLAELDATRLRQRWQQLADSPAPRVSPRLLRLALAYRIQTEALGGLSPSARRKLAQAAGGKTVTQQPGSGSRLVREWQGVAHIVTIDEGGIIRWNDREWKSLSAVARAITGGHWSGPAFFGLRKATPA